MESKYESLAKVVATVLREALREAANTPVAETQAPAEIESYYDHAA